jgi:hypothetical protein
MKSFQEAAQSLYSTINSACQTLAKATGYDPSFLNGNGGNKANNTIGLNTLSPVLNSVAGMYASSIAPSKPSGPA